MESNRVGIALIKLGAILIVINALQTLSGLSIYLNDTDGWMPIISAFVSSVAVPLAIAGLLWSFPATILGQSESIDENAENTSAYSFFLVGISLLGLYTLVFGIVDLVHFESLRIIEKGVHESNDFGPYQPSAYIVLGRVTNLAQILLGTLLLAGRSTLATVLYKIRRAGSGAS